MKSESQWQGFDGAKQFDFFYSKFKLKKSVLLREANKK